MPRRVENKIVGFLRRIRICRLWIKIENSQANRVNFVPRYQIAWNLRPGTDHVWRRSATHLFRVVNKIRRRGEVAVPLRQSGHRRGASKPEVTTDFFKVGKEESFVLSDRTTDRKTGLVALCVWFFAGRGIEEVSGVQLRTLQEIPSAAVESVRAALHDDVYDGTAVVAELRREAVVLDLEFLHALNQGLVVDVRVPPLALFRRAD